MVDRECPSCGTELVDELTCPECGHNLASSVVSTGARSPRGTDGDSEAEGATPAAVGARSQAPGDAAAGATGNVTAKRLRRTDGLAGTLLFDRPLVEYLRKGEQPEYVLYNRSEGLRRVGPDGSEEAPDADADEGGRFLVVTDQRLLYVAGHEDGDRSRDIEYDGVVGVEAGRAVTTGRLAVEVADGWTYEFETFADAQHVYDAAAYVHERAGLAGDPPRSVLGRALAATGTWGRWWNADLGRGLTPLVLVQTLFVLAAIVGVTVDGLLVVRQVQRFGRWGLVGLVPFVLVYAGVPIHRYLLTLAALSVAIVPTVVVMGYLEGSGLGLVPTLLVSYLVYFWLAALVAGLLYVFEALSYAFVVGALTTVVTQALVSSLAPVPGSFALLIGAVPGLLVAVALLRNFEYVIIASTATTGALLAAVAFTLVGRGRAQQFLRATRQSLDATVRTFTAGDPDVARLLDPFLALGVDVTVTLYGLFVLTSASGIVVQALLFEDHEWLARVGRAWKRALTGEAVES